MTVVMVTHERALAERYAQRMIFLADGKLIDDRLIDDRTNHAPSAVAADEQGART
jgi:ABC-type polar amino acid transport system ATPase subunit